MPGSTPRSKGSHLNQRPVTPMSERQQLKLVRQLETDGSGNKNNGTNVTLRSRSRSCNGRGETQLHKAAIRGDAEQVRHLLDEGADPNVPDFAGWTALHEACNHGWYDVALVLVQAGASVNARGFGDDTPLHDAAINGHSKLVQLLVEKGADVYLRNKDGKTPCDVAPPCLINQLLQSADRSGGGNAQHIDNSAICEMRRTSPHTKVDKSPRVTLRLHQVKSTNNDKRKLINTDNNMEEQRSNKDDVYEFKSSKEATPVHASSTSPDNVDVTDSKQDSTGTDVSENSTLGKRNISDVTENEENVEEDNKKKKRKDDSKEKNVTTSSRLSSIRNVNITGEKNTKSNQGKTGNNGGSGSGNGAGTSNTKSTTLASGANVVNTERKSPGSPSMSVDTDERSQTADEKTGLGPKVPPLKIVIPQQGTETESRNNKNNTARHHQALPYVVSSNSNDSETGQRSGSTSPIDPAIGMLSAEDQKSSLHHQRVLRSTHRSGSNGDSSGNNGASRNGGNGNNGNTNGNSGNNMSNITVTSGTTTATTGNITTANSNTVSNNGSTGNSGGSSSIDQSSTQLSDAATSTGSVPPAVTVTQSNLSATTALITNSGGQQHIEQTTGSGGTSSVTSVSETATTGSGTVVPAVPAAAVTVGGNGNSGLYGNFKNNASSSGSKISGSNNCASIGSSTGNLIAGASVSATGGSNGGNSSSSSSSSSGSSSASGEEKTNDVTDSTNMTSSVVDLHPRKRKLKHNKEVKETGQQQQPQQTQQQQTPQQQQQQQQVSADVNDCGGQQTELHPHEQPVKNCYQLFLDIRKQIERRRKGFFPVQPKPPQGFKDYLMNRCTYILAGNVSTRQVPSSPVPVNLSPALKDQFVEQEKERHRLRLQHVIEKEKLVLSVEQEILRVHGRAARALANQSLPFSVCTILKDEEVYNLITPEQEEKDRNARSRYNGRLFLSWLQDVDDKWEKIKEAMLLRHHNEAESLHAVQKMDWEWKMKELGLCEPKLKPVILDAHVPMVHVSDDFDLLPA